MNFALIGRSELSYDTAKLLIKNGHSMKLVVTAKEAPEYKYTAEDFRLLAERNKALYIYSPKIQLSDIESITKNESIDIAISVNYSGIISQEIINLFPLGILNAHCGDLPRYRGNACQAWAIINGEERIGLCIHKMIGGELDSGNIIEREYFPININTRIGEAFDWMVNRIPNMILSAVEKLMHDREYFFEIQSKDAKAALRCYPRIPEDGKISWHRSSVEILRLINASSEPYSGAFCFFDGAKVKILRAGLLHSDENYLAVPGQIAFIDAVNGNIHVICGEGMLQITEIEVENKRSQPAAFFKTVRKRLE